MNKTIIAVDFDGTIVAHAYPEIGRAAPGVFPVLLKLQEQGVLLILYTMRSGEYLQEAVDYCAENGINFWGVNQNPDQHLWTDSPKAYAHLYIDDAALGCPTNFDQGTNRNIVNWKEVETILIRKGILLS